MIHYTYITHTCFAAIDEIIINFRFYQHLKNHSFHNYNDKIKYFKNIDIFNRFNNITGNYLIF